MDVEPDKESALSPVNPEILAFIEFEILEFLRLKLRKLLFEVGKKTVV